MEQGSDRTRHADLVSRIDGHLGRLNCEYADRLASGRLRPLVIQELPPGTWNAYRAARISRLGGSLEQYKHPGLVGKLDFIDSLFERRNQASLAAT
jgi:hypothetical protein